MADASHQIVALKNWAGSLYSGLANMTDTESPLVAEVRGHRYALDWFSSHAVVNGMTRAVVLGGSLSAEGGISTPWLAATGSLFVGGLDVGSALRDLSSALSERLDIRSVASGIDLYNGTLVFAYPLAYAGDTTDDPSCLATLGWVSEAVRSAAYSFPVAGTETLGAVKVGRGLNVSADGVLTAYGEVNALDAVTMHGGALSISDKVVDIPAATSSAYGVVKVGSGISVTNGEISVSFPSGAVSGVYVGKSLASTSSGNPVVPYATNLAYGVVKVGSGVSVTDGTISVSFPSDILTGIAIGDIGSMASVSAGIAVVPSATSSAYGVVKIDGDTIKVSSTGAVYVAGGGGTVTDVRVGSTSLLSGSVATIPYGTASEFGVVMTDGSTLSVNSSSQVAVNTSVIASVSYVDSIVGSINSVLAAILGE